MFVNEAKKQKLYSCSISFSWPWLAFYVRTSRIPLTAWCVWKIIARNCHKNYKMQSSRAIQPVIQPFRCLSLMWKLSRPIEFFNFNFSIFPFSFHHPKGGFCHYYNMTRTVALMPALMVASVPGCCCSAKSNNNHGKRMNKMLPLLLLMLLLTTF